MRLHRRPDHCCPRRDAPRLPKWRLATCASPLLDDDVARRDDGPRNDGGQHALRRQRVHPRLAPRGPLLRADPGLRRRALVDGARRRDGRGAEGREGARGRRYDPARRGLRWRGPRVRGGGGAVRAARRLRDAARGDERPRSAVCFRRPRARAAPTWNRRRFCLVASIYSSERLGVAGTVAQSMGIWWIVLSRRRVFCARKRTIPAAAGSTSSSATIRRTRGPSTSRSSASTCAGASRARRSDHW